MTLNFATPASAQVAGPRTAANFDVSTAQDVTQVQWRSRRSWRGRSHWRGRHSGWRGHRYRSYRYYDRPSWGPVIGFGLGAAIGGLAAQASAIEWCDRRYRSYDRSTQTYLGYDGRRHSCP
jgi:hypothetical protein